MLDDRTSIAHLELTLPPRSPSVGIARHEVEHAIASYPEEVRTTVALLTSELASNAVIHAQTPFRVEAYGDRATVHVAIRDWAGRLPVVAPHDPTTLGGWGLSMVDAAASRWGIESDDTTTVWFEIDVDPQSMDIDLTD